LVTLRHYHEKDLMAWNQPVLLEQKNRSTVRWVIDPTAMK
jgi:hypothetical protein